MAAGSLLGITPATPNASRIGFVHNCYTTSLGRFFQETIKKGILSVLKRVHDKEIPRYDKTPYVYDDPRLKNLDAVLKQAFAQHLDDNDLYRKQEIGGMAADIVLFLMKEDVFYRMVIMRCIQHIAKDAIQHPEHYALTDFEQYLDEKFNGMGNVSTRGPPMDSYPSFEAWKARPECVAEWKAIHRPNGRGPEVPR
jgi:hypothetical protein